jgi:acyl transferase domain-containing protein/aryl carrier-like protein
MQEASPVEPVAIVGMACRFPGGPDVATYWKMLEAGGNAIIEIPKDRWNLDALRRFNDGKPLPYNVTHGGWLPDVRSFDNTFFRMSPREARTLDPKQRLALEVCYEAFEDASLSPEQLQAFTTGVFIGTAQSEYLMRFYNRMEIGTARSDRYVGPGNDCSFTSGRVSAMLGLDGPSVNVNTACSTSLVAVHMACRAIQNGECDIAAAGGVAIIESPEHSLTMNQFGVLSPDSQCKAFSDHADGYVRAEGCGVVLLRRLSDALAHGDRILAVIRGSAVNHNGLSDNLMAPESAAQSRLLRSALKVGGIDPDSVGYIEAHGTGTSVGDPIEVSALADVFAKGRSGAPAVVGSVKTNVGHLEVSAGVAGLIKTILALHHGKIPAHLHMTGLNPAIDPKLPFVFPTATMPWSRTPGTVRRAVVNSFGISGTNAAVVLEEAPAPAAVPKAPARPGYLLPLSAIGDVPLKTLAGRYADLLDRGADLAAVAHTAATGRNHLPGRAAIVATSASQASEALRALSRGEEHPSVRTGEARPSQPKIAFLFTGQGAQYVGMGKELYEAEPVFRDVVDRCDEVLRPLTGRSVRDVMLGRDTSVELDDTAWTQPALFVFELAMSSLWRSWGLEPDVLVGHSIGEIVAACVAEVLSVEDALALVAARGKLMSELPRDGAMASIFAPYDQVAAALVPFAADVSIASDNGDGCTISGRTATVEQVMKAFEAKGIGARPLTVSHAFHSPLMDPMLAPFATLVEGLKLRAPRRTLISNVTGKVAGPELTTPDYWVRHVRHAVRFREDMEVMAELGVTLVIEVGPHPVLSGMGRRVLPNHRATWLPSVRREQPYPTLLDTLASLYLGGLPLSWAGHWAEHRTARVTLPPYPFQRRPFWVDDPGPAAGGAVATIAPVATSAQPAYEGPDHYRYDWLPVEAYTPAPTTPGTWIVGLDRGGVAEAAAIALERAGHRVVRVVPADRADPPPGATRLIVTDPEAYRALIAPHAATLRGWLHCWSLDAPQRDDLSGRDWTATQDHTSLALMFAAQALLGLGAGDAGTWLITRGANAVRSGESPALAQAGGWGVARVVALEHRTFPNVRVDLDPNAVDGGAAQLTGLLLQPPADEDQLAFRRGGMYALRMVAHRPSGPRFSPRRDGAWLITGGLGALGLAVADWLGTHGVSRLILCGRSTPSPAAEQTIANLRARGTEVLIEAVDIGDPTQVRNLFHYVARKGVPIRGVVHAAGVLADGPVLKQDRDRFYQVFPAKVEGAWNLHLATRDLDLDAFVLFSSVTSTLGAPGQVNYAAANAFMDALAWYRHHRGLPALTINWGPWGEIGMAARLAQLMASRGMGGVPTAAGLDALGRSLVDPLPQVAYMDMRVRQILANSPAFEHAPLMREVMKDVLGKAPSGPTPLPSPKPAAPAAPAAASALDQLAATAPAQRREELIRRISALAEKQLGVEPGSVSRGRPLAWQGFDSVMALDLHGDLRKTFGVDLDQGAVTVGPSVEELTDLVLPQLKLPAAAVPLPQPAVVTPTATPAAPTSPAPVGLLASLAAAPATARADLLRAALQRDAEDLLGFGRGELDPSRPLAWQGFDSVMALDLHGRIKNATQVDLPLDALLNGPRLSEVVELLLPKLDLTKIAAAPPIASTPTPTAAPTGTGLRAELVAAAPGQRSALLAAHLARAAEELLGFDKGDLDPRRPLAWQGFDSVMALDLQRRILTETGVDLPLDNLVNGPKIEEVAEMVLPRIDLTAVATATAVRTVASTSVVTPARVAPPVAPPIAPPIAPVAPTPAEPLSPAPTDPQGPPLAMLVLMGLLLGAMLVMGGLRVYQGSGISSTGTEDVEPAGQGKRGKANRQANP